jgi:hypothetical protein
MKRKQDFIRQGANVARQFADRWLMSDMKQSLLVGYSRSYRCECGFACVDANTIYDHSMQCGVKPEQRETGP